MKKQTFNTIILLMASVLLLFASCNKPPEESSSTTTNILAENIINSSSEIDNVIAVLVDDENDDKWEVIASCKYENNGFVLNLPATIAAKYFYDDYFEPSMMSDPNAKCRFIDHIFGLNKNGESIGEFEYTTEGLNEDEGIYVYADRNFTYKGTESHTGSNFEDHYLRDCNFKKGWNLVYDYAVRSTKESIVVYHYYFTTQKPENMNFKWYFRSFKEYIVLNFQ